MEKELGTCCRKKITEYMKDPEVMMSKNIMRENAGNMTRVFKPKSLRK